MDCPLNCGVLSSSLKRFGPSTSPVLLDLSQLRQDMAQGTHRSRRKCIVRCIELEIPPRSLGL